MLFLEKVAFHSDLIAFVDKFQSRQIAQSGKVRTLMEEERNGGNKNTVYFSSSGEIFESVAQSLFMITKH